MVGNTDDVAGEPDYTASMAGQIDTCFYRLQEPEKDLNPAALPPGRQVVCRIQMYEGKLATTYKAKKTKKLSQNR